MTVRAYTGSPQPSMTDLQGLGVRVGDTEAPERKHLERLHAARLVILLMVVALRVQNPMNDQVRKTPRERPARLSGLFAKHRYAQNDIGLKPWLHRGLQGMTVCGRHVAVDESEHVGRVVALAKICIQRARLGPIDEPQCEISVPLQR